MSMPEVDQKVLHVDVSMHMNHEENKYDNDEDV